MPESDFHLLNPKKLPLNKWTAANPRAKEKHFLVTRVINPETAAHRIQNLKLEAVLTHRCFVVRWVELTDSNQWLRGWV